MSGLIYSALIESFRGINFHMRHIFFFVLQIFAKLEWTDHKRNEKNVIDFHIFLHLRKLLLSIPCRTN